MQEWSYNYEGVSIYPSDKNQLAHYGVVGMKWGMRRARKNGGVYNYRSHATKKYARKMKRYNPNSAKYKEYKKYYEKSKKMDKAEQNAAKEISGKAAAIGTLLGQGSNMKTYLVNRSLGMNKKNAAIDAGVRSAAIGAGLTGAQAAVAKKMNPEINGKQIAGAVVKGALQGGGLARYDASRRRSAYVKKDRNINLQTAQEAAKAGYSTYKQQKKNR